MPLGRTSVCTRSWFDRPSLSCSSLRSEFCSLSSCTFQSEAGSRRAPWSSTCCPASAFPSTVPARLVRLMAARGTMILIASTSVQASRFTLPRWSTPRGSVAGAGWVHFETCWGLAAFVGGSRAGVEGVVLVFASGTTGAFLVSMPSPAPRIGTFAESARVKNKIF